MHIVAETIMRPRPLQRPSDVERFPIEFGIEPNAPLPAKPVATIIKPAVSQEPDPIVTADEQEIDQGPVQEPPLEQEEWGEGIL